jgi:thiamine monophosphate synthase
MTSENQVLATFTHADGAVMTYDILGTQHLATNQTPIVLIGGMACRKVDWEYLANGLSTIRPGKLPNLLSS